jgi:hypothetical protein
VDRAASGSTAPRLVPTGRWPSALRLRRGVRSTAATGRRIANAHVGTTAAYEFDVAGAADTRGGADRGITGCNASATIDRVNLENQVRSILLLQPRNNDYGALVALFNQHDILGLAIREAGCLGAELQVPVSNKGPVLVTAVWRTAEAYAGWRSHAVRARFSDDIERLTEPDASPVQAGLYTIVIAAS